MTPPALHTFFHFHQGGVADNLPWVAKTTVDGQVATREALATFFGQAGFTEGVEVGTCHGAYALTLCQQNPRLHLTCVDPWAAYRGVPQARMNAALRHAHLRLDPHPVTFRRAPSLEVVRDWPNRSLDFVYIDGDHSFDAVVQDLVCWAPKVKVGGVVALHDYCPGYRAGVVDAVDAYTHAHHVDPWFITREQTPTAFWVNP